LGVSCLVPVALPFLQLLFHPVVSVLLLPELGLRPVQRLCPLQAVVPRGLSWHHYQQSRGQRGLQWLLPGDVVSSDDGVTGICEYTCIEVRGFCEIWVDK
jgi:hypothetical protein